MLKKVLNAYDCALRAAINIFGSRYVKYISFSFIATVCLAFVCSAPGYADSAARVDRSMLHPAGVMSNAASAAAAAAKAAEAAANAADTAAKAAKAALDAIRFVSPQPDGFRPGQLSPVPESELPEIASESYPPAAGDSRFAFPADQSLIGLIGRFEVPVNVEPGSELSRTLAGYKAMGEGPVAETGATNLENSLLESQNFSREIMIAKARLDQAKAQKGQALALLLPASGIRTSIGPERSSPSVALDSSGIPIDSETHTRVDSAFFIRQPLFDLPSYFDWRRRGLIERARNENYRGSDGDAYLATVNAYMSLVSTRLTADMTSDFEAQLRDLQIYIEKRARAGASSVSDMARVRARRESVKSTRIEQESAHTAAGLEFFRLTNFIPRMVRLPELAHVGISALPQSLDSAVSLAMTDNPEIASLKLEMMAAGLDKSVGKSRYLPRFDLEFTDTYSNHAGGAVDTLTGSATQRDQRVMVVASWSLFNGGGDYNFTRERAARYRELEYRLDDQRRRTTQSLSTNYGLLAITRERIAVGYKELKSISTAAEAMSKRMLSGNQSLLDLLDVYDRYYQARIRLVNLHILEMNTVAQTVRLIRSTPFGMDSSAYKATSDSADVLKRVPDSSAQNPASSEYKIVPVAGSAVTAWEKRPERENSNATSK